MSITIISANLNQYGNAGNFETDPSTWGFTPFDGNVSRSLTVAKKNIYSCKFECLAETFFPQFFIASGKAIVSVGKKYIIKAWIYVPSTDKLAASDSDEFIISSQGLAGSTTYTVVSSTARTQTSALNTWVEVTLQVQITGGSTIFYPLLTLDLEDEDPVNQTGLCYVDQFEIFEYEDDVEVCTVAINAGASVVTHETVEDTNDGTITVSASVASGTLEYSINSGSTWQSSNYFSGLSPGTYVILVREAAQTDCTANTAFTIQEADPAFTVAASATNETVLGNNDGSITITPSGGTGPYQYSVNGGSSFQSGNTFTGLAPGNYAIVVTDSTPNTAYANALITAGSSEIAGIVFSKNPIPFSVNKGANYAEDNYRLYADVLVEEVPGTGSFNKKLAMALEPESNGLATFYLQEAFAGLFKATPPTKNINTIKEAVGRALLYKVGNGELYDDYTDPQNYTVSNIYRAILGGISKRLYPTLDFLNSYLPDQKKFLSWKPTERLIDATQEEYLTFFNYSNTITQIKLFAKAWYTDGTEGDEFDTGLSLATTYGRHYEIPAGAAFNNVSLQEPTKTLLKYQLWLENNAGTEVTERITYKLTKFRKENTRYFMYLNSLGAFEVVGLTGMATEESRFEKETMQTYLGHAYTGPELESFRSSYQNSWKMSSGYYEGPQGYAYIKSLTDLLLSTKVYDITDGNRNPRLVLPGTVQMKQDKDTRYFLRFTCAEPFIEQNFTPNV
ncbi:MAG: SprB repeat-containing protein [Cytophagia bacterium]|nr:SprB repeat-containing protein [Cytophagia bacterium]